MGQPNPPGDIPLYDGLGTEWNDIVGAFPEDRRNELAPILKSRLDSYEPLKQWEDFHKSGITPDQASAALNVFKILEDNPRQVYDVIGQHLGLTKQEVKEVVENVNDGVTAEEDPRIAAMQNQINVLSQIALSQRDQEIAAKTNAEQDAALEREMTALKKKYSDVNEREILMRMAYGDMTAEQAYQDYANLVSEARTRRPAPMVMGSGGAIPRNAIDVKKLDPLGVRNLTAQMMQHALDAEKQG